MREIPRSSRDSRRIEVIARGLIIQSIGVKPYEHRMHDDAEQREPEVHGIHGRLDEQDEEAEDGDDGVEGRHAICGKSVSTHVFFSLTVSSSCN